MGRGEWSYTVFLFTQRLMIWGFMLKRLESLNSSLKVLFSLQQSTNYHQNLRFSLSETQKAPPPHVQNQRKWANCFKSSNPPNTVSSASSSNAQLGDFSIKRTVEQIISKYNICYPAISSQGNKTAGILVTLKLPASTRMKKNSFNNKKACQVSAVRPNKLNLHLQQRREETNRRPPIPTTPEPHLPGDVNNRPNSGM